MIRTKADLLEYIQEDMRMQPRSSSFVKRYLGTSGAVVRWKKCLRKCEYHHNISKNIYHRLAYFVYLFMLKRYDRRFCSEIPINVFGKGLLIWHPERIIIILSQKLEITVRFRAVLLLRRHMENARQSGIM